MTWRVQADSGIGFTTDEQGVFWMDSADGRLADGTPRDGTDRVELPLSEAAAAGTDRIWFSIVDVIGNRDTTSGRKPDIAFEVTGSGVTTEP